MSLADALVIAFFVVCFGVIVVLCMPVYQYAMFLASRTELLKLKHRHLEVSFEQQYSAATMVRPAESVVYDSQNSLGIGTSTLGLR